MSSPSPTIQQTLELAVQHYQAGRLREAEQLCLDILFQFPDQPNALHCMAVIAFQTGRTDGAENMVRRVLAHNPDFAEAQLSLGNILRAKRRLDDAIAAYRKAISLRPNLSEAHFNLGVTLRQANRPGDAIAAFRDAVAHRPDFLDALENLGVTLREQDRLDEAIAAFRRAIELRPDRAEGYYNLGVALGEKELFDEAVAAYRRAIELRPDFADCYANLGNVLKDRGELDAAIAAFRRSCQLDPNKPDIDSNILYTLEFHPGCNARQIAEEQHRWNRIHAEPLRKSIVAHTNDRASDRRLRIGYVSPYFYDQAECFFVVPLLSSHNHKDFEIHCYASVRRPDHITECHRACVDGWHDVLGRTDAELAQQIRDDKIDILIDLAMHMAYNRALLFARKPAPIQVAWLAYPGGTGLDAMDYRITDSFMDPPDADQSVYREQPIRLPDSWCCYNPGNNLPPITPRLSGPIRFASLNNPCKLNEPILRLWARVLQAVPDSTLLLQVISEQQRQGIRELLNSLGISAPRIEFAARLRREEYLRLYGQIDICLDPLPYNGITTTCDALCMGAAVVTLAGKTAAGRAGLSILKNLGLPELTAGDPDHFVSMTANLARDRGRLSELRAGLRDRMRTSPIMDAPRFARNMESAYRQIWQRWCTANRS